MMYTARDTERFLAEPDKRAGRTEFMRDRARIIHAASLRRLAAKTQVAVPWENDFQRTRLSHSLECAQIGRELGSSLGADPDLVDTACLAHDLGHPPFGHNGEEALAEIAAPAGGFEGNAQTFRILTRLEAKTHSSGSVSVGLNLTRASLDAATKYPWDSATNPRKYGVYEADREIFSWMREGAPANARSIEAQIMDWSDDISYSVHDLEDGIVAGQIDVKNFERDFDAIFQVLQEDFGPEISQDEAGKALARLQSVSTWPKNFSYNHRDLGELKNLTSELIGRFVRSAESATRERYGAGELTRFSADLVIPQESRREVDVLKSIAGFYLIRAEHSQERYAKQRQVLKDLVEIIMASEGEDLEPLFLPAWNQAEDEASKLRVVIDYVASLTDPGAYALHAQLSR